MDKNLAMLPEAQRKRIRRMLGLGKTSEHKVFVYGTLLSGEANSHWARRARRQSAWTTGTLYDTGWGFPAMALRGRTRIAGEILTVDDEGLGAMDRLEGYPRLYRREHITASLAGGGRVVAWVYVMNRLPEGATLIADGDWRTHRRGGSV